MGPSYQAFPEGGSLIIYEDDPTRTHEQLAKFSKKDADALAEVQRLARGHRRGDGPAADPGAAEHRLAAAVAICSTWPSWPGADARHDHAA